MSAASNAYDPQQPLLIQACQGKVLPRPPVWMMRQAGRYMPEYQAIRNQLTFLELCKDIDKAVEVSLQPYKTFGMDGVIMFSDILTIPEAMGMQLDFTEKGPTFADPIRHRDRIADLPIPDPNKDIAFVPQILKTLSAELKSDPHTTLIGFSGSPWTLASYMIEGGTSKHFEHIKRWLFEDPKSLHRLLEKLADSVGLYLIAQIDAGAQVVQLFDNWAGILSREKYRHFVLPYHQQIIDQVKQAHPQTPVILYVNNSRGLLDLMKEAGPDVISVDEKTSLTEARSLLGNNMPLQGNLDPLALFADPATLKSMVAGMLLEGGHQNYIFNLGHGILPKTPVSNVKLVVDMIKQSSLSPVT